MYGCGLLLQGIGSVTPKRRSNRKMCIKVCHKFAFQYGELWSRGQFGRKFHFTVAVGDPCQMTEEPYQVGAGYLGKEGRKGRRKGGRKRGRFGF